MSNNKPDEIDYKIMTILQQDALISVEVLATRVFRSKTAVHDRIKKLRETGYIKRYTTTWTGSRINSRSK